MRVKNQWSRRITRVFGVYLSYISFIFIRKKHVEKHWSDDTPSNIFNRFLPMSWSFCEKIIFCDPLLFCWLKTLWKRKTEIRLFFELICVSRCEAPVIAIRKYCYCIPLWTDYIPQKLWQKLNFDSFLNSALSGNPLQLRENISNLSLRTISTIDFLKIFFLSCRLTFTLSRSLDHVC